jgi:hypothetical protein
MSGRELSKEEIQKCYDNEHASIGKFSSLISVSCKYAWAGSLALFFSTIVAANAETLDRFKSVFYFLWAAAFLGAVAFVCEILQYLFAYLHARQITTWLLQQKRVAFVDLESRVHSTYATLNGALFWLKLVFAVISAALVAIAIFLVAFRTF